MHCPYIARMLEGIQNHRREDHNDQDGAGGTAGFWLCGRGAQKPAWQSGWSTASSPTVTCKSLPYEMASARHPQTTSTFSN
ncbi:hypothetical protein BDW68DRAFT_21784 [Aspergillus falconensis]